MAKTVGRLLEDETAFLRAQNDSLKKRLDKLMSRKSNPYPLDIPTEKLRAHSERTSVCCVYFVSNAAGAVKIGVSRDPKRRLVDLQVANSDPVNLLGMIKFTGKDAEKNAYICENSLHAKYQKHNISGEWFDTNAREKVERHIMKIAKEYGGKAWKER